MKTGILVNHRPLNDKTLLRAVDELVLVDADLKYIVDTLGAPPLWDREEGFHSLIRIVLEQQVSLKSAKAAYDKLMAGSNLLTPQKFLEFSDSQLKSFGFSRQKTKYCKNVAIAILDGSLDFIALRKMENTSVKSELMRIKGIGNWTADIYLLMILKRPDVWPQNDLALAIAMKKVKNLEHRPDNEEMINISQNWKPWRAVAARILWHYYLNNGKV